MARLTFPSKKIRMLHPLTTPILLPSQVDFNNAMAIYQQSLSQIKEGTHCLIDFTAVTHCNSVGVALMVEWVKVAKKHHQPIHFIGVPDFLQSVLKAANLSFILA